MRFSALAGEKAGGLPALYTGEVGQKGVKRIAFRDVVKEGLERHTSARKARGSVHNVRIDSDDLIETQFLYTAHCFHKIGRPGCFPQALFGPRNQGRSHGSVEV